MCGIVGFWQFSSSRRKDFKAAEIVLAMTRRLTHRGPDDGGTWVDDEIGVALGHRRLSILDLTEHGHQPMTTADRQHVLVFNGEIYNYKVLLKSLRDHGVECEGRGDTEVLLSALVHWGVEKVLPILNGMFAFAYFDRHRRTLWLARDRFGEKPLYYTFDGDRHLLFGSELKALLPFPGFKPQLNDVALDLYLRFNYIPCPHSIYSDTYKLFPGHYLEIGPNHLQRGHYFSLTQLVSDRILRDVSEEEHVRHMDQLLSRSVGDRMLTDVPIGAFLSGGIDSSLMTAYMQSHSARPVKTFTVGFRNSPYDESRYAEAVAKHLKTDHTTLFVTEDEALEGVECVTDLYDEPFGDASALSTYLVAKLFRRHVTVAVGGDGGDELFVGYHRHKWVPRLFRVGRWTPRCLARLLGMAGPLLKRGFGPLLGTKIQKGLSGLQGRDFLCIYLNAVSFFKKDTPLAATWFHLHPQLSHDAEQVMYLDMRTYMHDDVLCKVDRATMGVGLEARAPFLDHEVVAQAWNIPLALKYRRNTKKYLLKKILNRYLPEPLWNRPKMGFGMPLDKAFRTTIKAPFEALLKEDTALWKYIDRNHVQSLWEQHRVGRQNNELSLWNVFVAQKWLASRT
jgi:asparagine synthase (glutamine-hydrolysing)